MNNFLGSADGSDTEGNVGGDLLPPANAAEDLLEDTSVRIDPLIPGRPLPVYGETILSKIDPNPIGNQQELIDIAEAEEVDYLFVDETIKSRLLNAQTEANAHVIRDMQINQAKAAFLKERKQPYSKRKPKKGSAASKMKEEASMKSGVKKKRCGRCRKWKTTECQCPRKSGPRNIKRATKSVPVDFMTDTSVLTTLAADESLSEDDDNGNDEEEPEETEFDILSEDQFNHAGCDNPDDESPPGSNLVSI